MQKGGGGNLRESIGISWTVVMVVPSSGTLTFRLRASELLRCQKGTVSWVTTVSLREVGDRPMDKADSLSEEKMARDWVTGLLEEADGQN